jgi:hypothetical protein
MIISRRKSKKNLLQCHFISHEPNRKPPEIKPKIPGETVASNVLSYATTLKIRNNLVGLLRRLK